jgi:hypothetical protein
MSAFVARERVTVVAAVAAMAAGAGVTALVAGHQAPPHVVSLPVAGHTQDGRAVLEVRSGTAILHVSVAGLAGALVRVSTPDDAPARPVLSGGSKSAAVVLTLAGDDGSRHRGPYAVSVTLSSSVVWSLDFAGGTQRTTADLRGGKVAGIAVTAGSDVLTLALPRPAGDLPVLLAGGASQCLISLPGGVPARVTAGGGAALVAVDGQSQAGVAGGTVISSPGWATAMARLDIDATAGVSRLLVTRYPAGS